MRSILAATLALTPVLLHAQAPSPAKTANPVLLAFAGNPAADRASASPGTTRVSSGVTPPRLIHSEALVSNSPNLHILGSDKTMIVNMIVDASGKPQHLSLQPTAGIGAGMDKEVLKAISQYRYQPGTLDGQPTAVPVKLVVTVEHGTHY